MVNDIVRMRRQSCIADAELANLWVEREAAEGEFNGERLVPKSCITRAHVVAAAVVRALERHQRLHTGSIGALGDDPDCTFG